MDRDLVGLIGLDGDGAIVECNRRGRDVLNGDGVLAEECGRLVAGRAEDAAAVERLLAQVLAGPAAPRGGVWAIVGGWPDHRPRTLYAKAVAGSRGPCRKVVALVAVVDPWMRVPVSPELVGAALGLTPAESQVVCALAEGMSVKAIARRSKRVPDSVRRLIKQALAKTWSARQSDLVRLALSVSRLPVPAATELG